MSCAKCKNPRKKTYQHVSGQELCYTHLREAALDGRKDFRHKHKQKTSFTASPFGDEDNEGDIDKASIEDLRAFENSLITAIHERRRLLNRVRKRLRTLALKTKGT